ncbi:MAG: carboxypeptidase-like regulatory domain-containing protein, partial [Bacteroidota bacterium]
MKTIYNWLFMAVLLCTSTATFSQGVLTGTIMDAELGEPLPGASVVVRGTSTGTSTDFDGNFQLNVDQNTGTLVISYIGFQSTFVDFTISDGETRNLGSITIAPNAEELEGVVIVGVADIAKDRETPVAVSTIKASEIVERLGNQELPELLNATPSVYATKSGGGFGDSRINIRGFDQVNTAVLINGVPVNDMENGRVFWSNWTGLADIASAIQVQRGLGSSKLAISSVGGTLNIITKTTDREEGGFVGTTFGNNNYIKTIASYSTGRMDNGLAVSALFSRTAGDGYVNGTAFEGYNYFIGIGWTDENYAHSVQFTATGAPQVHNQRTTSFFNMAELGDYLQYGKRYNYNHGILRGQEFNWRKNFYHKPVVSVNWDWNINENSKLSSVLYASFARGGGTGDLGRLDGRFSSDSRFRDPDTGAVQWDNIVSSNSGIETTFSNGSTYANMADPYFPETPTFIVNDPDLTPSGDETNPNFLADVVRRNGFIRRASMNSHNWYGLLANFNTKLSERLTLDFGVDLRSYKGFHYRRIDDLLGADGYRDNNDLNNPFNVLSTTYSSDFSSILNVFRSIDREEKIDYYNIGFVRWAGVFGQLEYKNDAISAFIQFSGSNQGFKREDFFGYLDSDPQRITDWENIMGGNIKAGINYNIDEQNNVFANAGYYSRQPLFDAVYVNFANELNSDYRNEQVIG